MYKYATIIIYKENLEHTFIDILEVTIYRYMYSRSDHLWLDS